MSDVIVENESPPDSVMEDVRSLRQIIRVERMHVEAGPGSRWTLRIESETDRSAFESIANMVEENVSSDDVRRFYDYDDNPYWSIHVRY